MTIPPLPTPPELATIDPDDLRSMLVTDRALASFFAARADIVAEVLAWRHRGSSQLHTSTAALNVDDVMQRTGMSRQWVYRNSKKGKQLAGCCRKQGRRRVWDADKLARWCDRQRG